MHPRPLELPVPSFVTRPVFLATVALVHAYLGASHLMALASGALAWTHVWKGFGALFGAYTFAALVLQQLASRRTTCARAGPG